MVCLQPDDYDLFDGFKTTISREHDAIFIFVETIEEMVEHTTYIIREQPLLEKGYPDHRIPNAHVSHVVVLLDIYLPHLHIM